MRTGLHLDVAPECRFRSAIRTVVMGILNVTPDSFSDGGAYSDPARRWRGRWRSKRRAPIFSISGASRAGPEAWRFPKKRNFGACCRSLKRCSGKLKIPISVDTYRSEVARRALEAGAQIVNDISAFRFDPAMAEMVSAHRAGVVLMHSRGNREELHIATADGNR